MLCYVRGVECAGVECVRTVSTATSDRHTAASRAHPIKMPTSVDEPALVSVKVVELSTQRGDLAGGGRRGRRAEGGAWVFGERTKMLVQATYKARLFCPTQHTQKPQHTHHTHNSPTRDTDIYTYLLVRHLAPELRLALGCRRHLRLPKSLSHGACSVGCDKRGAGDGWGWDEGGGVCWSGRSEICVGGVAVRSGQEETPSCREPPRRHRIGRSKADAADRFFAMPGDGTLRGRWPGYGGGEAAVPEV